MDCGTAKGRERLHTAGSPQADEPRADPGSYPSSHPTSSLQFSFTVTGELTGGMHISRWQLATEGGS